MTRTGRLAAAVAALVIGGLALAGCAQRDDSLDEPVGKAGWLAGDARTKLDTVAEQLGGFGRTMVEVGYRYEVLYWAGTESNWELAAHQVEELVEAMEHGLERRPERRQSSVSFLTAAVPMMEEVIARGDSADFPGRFEAFRGQCNACHAMEKVQFIWVETPRQRVYPWGPLQPG